MKILMVCLGNICRSPLAQGILEQKIEQKGLEWTVDSAGTSGWHEGEPPDPRSVAEADRRGLDISQQRSRPLEEGDLEHFDLIFAMDQSNRQNILAMNTNAADLDQKVKLILEELEPDSGREVPDPYWNDDGFTQVYDMLEKACGEIVRKYSKR